MPTISSNDIRNGTVIKLDGKLFGVIWFQHHKPGKGNTVIRLKMRDLVKGGVLERTIPADQKVESAVVEKREMSYLYADGEEFVFMDSSSYDQLHVTADDLGDAKNYLTEGLAATMSMYEGRPIAVELPASVELTITHTDPGVQGDRVSGATKPATLETGFELQVPLFIEPGERIKVDTREGAYITRVKS
jgi:elongation factor P